MRKLILAICLLLGATQVSAKPRIQPSPANGVVAGTVYTNEFFHLTWEFPKDWKVREVPAPAEGAHYYVLLSLSPNESQDSEEVSLSAQDFSDTDHFWKQYLDQVKATLTEKGWQAADKRHTITAGSRGFDVDEYVSADTQHYVAVAACPLHSHELKLFVASHSHERLEELLRAISSANFSPDWSDGVVEESSTGPPGPVTPAKLVDHANPNYPSAARAARVQGSVVMAVIVGKSGKIDQIYVLQGHPFLLDSAIEAVSRWRYIPYKRSDGTPIAVNTEVVVNFSLSNAGR